MGVDIGAFERNVFIIAGRQGGRPGQCLRSINIDAWAFRDVSRAFWLAVCVTEGLTDKVLGAFLMSATRVSPWGQCPSGVE